VYDALLEALKAGNTVILCTDLPDEYERLCRVNPDKGKSRLQEQYEVRNDITFVSRILVYEMF